MPYYVLQRDKKKELYAMGIAPVSGRLRASPLSSRRPGVARSESNVHRGLVHEDKAFRVAAPLRRSLKALRASSSRSMAGISPPEH
jgi:hypothetical protein